MGVIEQVRRDEHPDCPPLSPSEEEKARRKAQLQARRSPRSGRGSPGRRAAIRPRVDEEGGDEGGGRVSGRERAGEPDFFFSAAPSPRPTS